MLYPDSHGKLNQIEVKVNYNSLQTSHASKLQTGGLIINEAD